MTEKPVVVHYVTEDVRNVEAMMRILVSVDGQRMDVGEALRLGLMFQTPTGGFEFNARRCRDLAPTLVDTLSGKRRALPVNPAAHVEGLQPRVR